MLRNPRAILIVLLLLITPVRSGAQILQDTSTLNLVKQNVGCIYNLQFEEAREIYDRIVRRYPTHPIVHLLKGMTTYWENYPMLHSSPSHVSFEEDMRACIKVSEKSDKTGHEAEYLLADLCARGMLLMFYDDNELVMDVTPLMISTYKYIRRAFDLTSASIDLYYFTGLYNYFREAYPKAYPVYKSLAFLFPRGSMSEGLQQLQAVEKNSVILKAEASILLIWIYLSFENDVEKSSDYSRYLFRNYPQNGFFRAMYIRNLLLERNYDEADKLIYQEPEEKKSRFLMGQLAVVKGILQEKKYHDNHLANHYYHEGILELSNYGRYGNEFTAYGYFGLSRLSDSVDQMNKAKTYRKEASKLAEFRKITFDK